MRGWIIALTVSALTLALGGELAAASLEPVRQMLSAGRVDDALKALQARLESGSRDAEAYHLQSRAYLALKNWSKAAEAAERAVALEPNNSNYHMWLGRAYGEKASHSNFFTAAGLAGKVRSEFERAVELDAANVAARSDLAEFYIEAPGIMGGGKDKARAQAEQLAGRDTAAAHWVRARLAEKDKKYDEAEKEYRAATQGKSGQAGAWLNLASFYRNRGRLPEMESAINKAVAAMTGKDGHVLVDAASLLLVAGRNFALAEQLLRRYLNSESPVAEAPVFQARYLLGTILEKQGDSDGAATQYEAALSLAGNYEEAEKALKRVRR